MTNLLGNAIKFTHEGEVRLVARAEREPGGWVLSIAVEDSGIGIRPEVLPGLFEAFMQAVASASRRYGGTGLGLSISKRLAEMMGGTIAVSSTVGEGSEFCLTVSLREGFGGDPVAELPPRLAAKRPTDTFAGARVLVVEDHPVNQRVMQSMLERWGIEVTIAADGKLALEALRGTSFELVLMDCQMPVMDGFEATRRLRELEAESGAPRQRVVALTANALDGDRERCLEAGMDEYLSKPVDPKTLFALLEALVESEARVDA